MEILAMVSSFRLIMTTLNQRYFLGVLKKKKHLWARALRHHSQLRGWVTKVVIITPRKPNSARRSVAKVDLNNNIPIASYIPGVGHNLRKYSTVLVRGGGARDLPGVSYACIRGVYDFMGLKHKTKRRSIYGVKWPVKTDEDKRVRRKNKLIKLRLTKKQVLKIKLEKFNQETLVSD